MKRKAFTLCVWALAVVLVAGPGCGRGAKGPGGVRLYPVGGTLTQGGKPLEGAIVRFVSADGKHFAVGTTDASGKYSLTTSKSGDGAPAAEYQVAVDKFPGTPEAASKAASDDRLPTPKSLLPPKYSNPKMSGFSASVKEGGANQFAFDVR